MSIDIITVCLCPKYGGGEEMTLNASPKRTDGDSNAAISKSTGYKSLKLGIGITNCEANSASWSV